MKWLHSLKEPNCKLQRWRIRLNEYDFDIAYIKGKENQAADFLSRLNVDKQEINNIEQNYSDKATIRSCHENLCDHIPITDNIVNKYNSQIHRIKEKKIQL